MTYDEMRGQLNPYNPYGVKTLEPQQTNTAQPLYSQGKTSQAGKQDSGINWGQVAGTAATIASAIFSDKTLKDKIKGIDIKSLTSPKKVSDDPIVNSIENPQHNATATTALIIEFYKDMNKELDDIISQLEAPK